MSGNVNSFCFYGATLLAIIVTADLFIFKHRVLGWLRVTPSTYQYTAIYYEIIAAVGILIIISLVPINTLQTDGLTANIITVIIGFMLYRKDFGHTDRAFCNW